MKKEEIVTLLETDLLSREYFDLLAQSNVQSRKMYGEQGMVFAQIGLNAEPCSKNCKFCSMGSSHYSMDHCYRKSVEEVVQEAKALIEQQIDALFLMITADYSIQDFISIAEQVRKVLPKSIRLVANTGDITAEEALAFKRVGINGVYHIRRLREGVDTLCSPEVRQQSLDNIKAAGLDIYYCIEPIGPEHSYSEIADEILFAKSYPIDYMAVMRRIAVPGTPLYHEGQITLFELAKIAAVTNLAICPTYSMNVHEPNSLCLMAGINQLYAEVGANPRDVQSKTENSRGYSVSEVWEMLAEAGYYPSKIE